MSCKNRYWKLVKNDSDDISSDFQYFSLLHFSKEKTQKLENTFLKILQFFIFKFPSTQSKSFFQKIHQFLKHFMVGRIWKILKNEITDFELVINTFVTNFLIVTRIICHHLGLLFLWSIGYGLQPMTDFLSDPTYDIIWELSNKLSIFGNFGNIYGFSIDFCRAYIFRIGFII